MFLVVSTDTDIRGSNTKFMVLTRDHDRDAKTLSAVPLSLPAICHIMPILPILMYFVFAKKLENRFGNNDVNFKLKHLTTTIKYRHSQSCESRVRFNPPNIAS